MVVLTAARGDEKKVVVALAVAATAIQLKVAQG